MDEMDSLRKDRYSTQRKVSDAKVEYRKIEEDIEGTAKRIRQVERSLNVGLDDPELLEAELAQLVEDLEVLKTKKAETQKSIDELEAEEEAIRSKLDLRQARIRSSNERLLGFDRDGSMYTWLDVRDKKTETEAAKYIQKHKNHRQEGVSSESEIYGAVVEQIAQKYFYNEALARHGADSTTADTSAINSAVGEREQIRTLEQESSEDLKTQCVEENGNADKSEEIDCLSPRGSSKTWFYSNSYDSLRRFLRTLNERGIRERELLCSLRDRLKEHNINLPYPLSNHAKKSHSKPSPEDEKAVDVALECLGEWLQSLGQPLNEDSSTCYYLGGSEQYQLHMLEAARRKIKTLVRVCGRPSMRERDLAKLETMPDFIDRAAKVVKEGVSEDAALVVRDRLSGCTIWSSLCHLLAYVCRSVERGTLGKLKDESLIHKGWAMDLESSDDEVEDHGVIDEEDDDHEEDKTVVVSRPRRTAVPKKKSDVDVDMADRESLEEESPPKNQVSARELRAARRSGNYSELNKEEEEEEDIKPQSRVAPRRSSARVSVSHSSHSTPSSSVSKKRTRSSLSNTQNSTRRNSPEMDEDNEESSSESDDANEDDDDYADNDEEPSKKARYSTRGISRSQSASRKESLSSSRPDDVQNERRRSLRTNRR
jgi:hypothetical protein